MKFRFELSDFGKDKGVLGCVFVRKGELAKKLHELFELEDDTTVGPQGNNYNDEIYYVVRIQK